MRDIRRTAPLMALAEDLEDGLGPVRDSARFRPRPDRITCLTRHGIRPARVIDELGAQAEQLHLHD